MNQTYNHLQKSQCKATNQNQNRRCRYIKLSVDLVILYRLFLKVENLRVKFDVRNADADMMLGKWNDLLEKKVAPMIFQNL